MRSIYLVPALAILVLAGCGVSEPDDQQWKQPSAYIWPAEIGTKLQYRVEKTPNGLRIGADPNDTVFTNDMTVERSDSSYNGVPMYELRESRGGWRFWRHYLAVGDTVIARNEAFPADLLLVGPLEQGRTWVCGYQVDTIPWQATVIDRYAWKKVEGRVYKNVIEVEYKPVVSPIQESWTRLYAEGIGPIQTVKNYSPLRDTTAEPALPQVERSVLIDASIPLPNAN